MVLMPIQSDLSSNQEFLQHPDCGEILLMTVDFYRQAGFQPPWIGYFVELDGRLVGSCAFKGAPRDGKVEIAYGVFPVYRQQGIGTKICRQLVRTAQAADPTVRVNARTLPEENYSTRILRNNGFEWLGVVWDEEDGDVWEWEFKDTGSIQEV